MSLCCSFLFAALILYCFGCVQSVEVYVDSIAGNDTACASLQELQNQSLNGSYQIPCKTINQALGNVKCGRLRSCENSNPLYHSVVKLSDGVHILQECIAILQGENVTLVAENQGQATIKCTTFGNAELHDNLVSCGTRGLEFRGIIFEGCGPLSSNVFINGSTDVLFEDCSFRKNIGSPLRVQFVPTIALIRTDFIHNMNEVAAPEDDENTTTSELFSSISTSGGFTYYSQNGSVSIIIDQCKFISNRGNLNRASNTRPLLLKANGHGGAVVIRLSSISNGTINITNSLFDDNEAEVDGGGIHFALSDQFSSNSVHLYNNSFVDNRALQSSGGAISWLMVSSLIASDNSWVVEDCNFDNNTGSAGGAVSLSLLGTSLESFLLPDRVEFIHCLFYNNEAMIEGTAVGLYALLHVEEFGFPVEFTDCNFTANHYSLEKDISEESIHSSALLAFRFPVEFSGYNHFVGNIGGGITLLNARLRVRGELLLLNNEAVFGGGIAMDDSCLIEVFPDVSISLINNTAIVSGGGIHVTVSATRHTTTFFNRLCFLQYSSPLGTDTPLDEWQNVSIDFIGNQAWQSGAAIYASDMLLCSWIGNNYKEGNIFSDQQEFGIESPFHYNDNVLLGTISQVNMNLATAPDRIHIAPMLQSNYVQPGEKLLLDILCTDQLSNSREAVWLLEAPQQEILDGISAHNGTYLYTVPQVRSIIEGIQICTENTTGAVSLNFSLPNTLGHPTGITLDFNGCHPGYAMNPDTCLCQCNSAADSSILRCDENSRYIYLRSGVWGDPVVIGGDRQLVTAHPPAYYLSCQREGRLAGCLFQWDHVSAQCRTGRHGKLCGLCDEGFGITLDLQTCEANDNCILGLSLFIIFCILVVILSFLVLYFNIGLPNELKGLFFYLQVIGLVFRPYFVRLDSSSNTDSISPLAILTNIVGFSIPIPLCVSTSLQAQHIALLGYIPPILVLATVMIYAVSARFSKLLSGRSSLNGITLLSLLIYKQIADTSFTFISCSSTDIGWVFTYNGSVSCSSLEMVIFVVIGFMLVVLFALPVPFGVAYICIKRPIKFQHYADILTKELHASRRWFGGWDIGRRLPFVFFGYIFVRPTLVLFLMSLAALFVLLVHLLAQPYEKRHVNIIESLVLINLTVVSILFLNPSNSQASIWFSTCLLLVPYAYGFLYFVWILIRYILNRYYEKHKNDSNLEDNFFMKEKHITMGRKRLNIGGVGHLFLSFSDTPLSHDTDTAHNISTNNVQNEKYSEQQFSEFRESDLEF